MKLRTVLLCASMLAATIVPGLAGDRDVVEDFYTELLSAPNAADLEQRVSKVVVDNWVSIPQPRGGPEASGLVNTLKFFGSVIPDLKWEPQEILQDGNRFIVRSTASGTPVKPFFGVEPTGNSFKIMTIDIHTVENGRIVKSYHVEEWATAIQQVKGD